MNELAWTNIETHHKGADRCPDKGFFVDLEGVCLMKK